MNKDNIDTDEHIEPSKSQLKREAHALQELGERLVALSPAKLSQLVLEEDLIDAIKLAQSLEKKHGARKRQLQFIGKLMRNLNAAAIEVALEKLLKPDLDSIKQFHSIENWRDKLVKEGDMAIDEFMLQHVTADRQSLRQLVRNSQSNNAQQAVRSKRKLFKFINELISDKQ